MNMQEMLQTRAAHEELTTEVARFLKEQGFETFTLSTESCDICEDCAYPHGKPCRHPDRMHPWEAVQVAVESGNLPRDVCADALLTLGCTFHRALKELRAEIYEDAAADAPP